MTESLSEMGLAHPCRSVDEDMFPFFHKQAGGEIRNNSPLDPGVEGKVESFQGFFFFKACFFEAGLKLLRFPSLDLVLHHKC